MIEYKDRVQISIADLPGLVEGASENKGLGHQFLKHIERTKVICFVIDVGENDRDPFEDYENLKTELKLYNPALLTRHSVVVANKMDVKGSLDALKYFKEELVKNFDLSLVIPISAKEKQNIQLLKDNLRLLVEHLSQPEKLINK
jgi:GTP-binding protein